MVEGPKYHRHAQLLRQALLTRRLRVVSEAQLRSLVGCKVLEVFAVGKELFILFGIRWDESRRGSGVRLHFGHGGGYLVERGAERWGPKAAGGGHCRDGPAALTMEFSADGDADDPLRFLLWNDLGSFYGHVSVEYLRAVEARSIFDINAPKEAFALATARGLFLQSEELVVDLLMDQSRLPGVGNIIKCEGLFAARIFPLRRSCELSADEWTNLLEELHRFSDLWYQHCQKSQDGQHMGCCHLMRIYGHWTCSSCQGPISLIKEGRRQRITYFCPRCQPGSEPARRPHSHRQELPVELPPCKCGFLPALLQVRSGVHFAMSDDRRPYLSCSQRRGSKYDDGGCGLPGPWDGCGFHSWLDEISPLPNCDCQAPSLLRRVVGMKENGRYFLRCRQRRCRFRCWLKLALPEHDVRRSGRWRRPAEDAESSSPQTSSSEKDVLPDVSGWDSDRPREPPMAGYKTKRWGKR
ncbi:unnamed protein product [Effrenium voratum]|uniref:FPG-type domain-containing protein n=1 Tax=Effrenium voratum TaxID=2562239 RepID=A0AA36HMK8_9DINO|nr:unnamed protein product [Effrenium voratum]CAJ1423333.1 unnamed protein product [Effrenium voratum]